MPKIVDHRERRREIADAVSRIAQRRGLDGVSFREVAREAGVSVSLVQHYFGNKERLLFDSLEIQSRQFAGIIARRLDTIDTDDPIERLRAIATSFIAADDESRRAMVLYHAFAGAALTDPSLRQAAAFTNARGLSAAIEHELSQAQASGGLRSDLDPGTEAATILALVLGLSLAVLLDQTEPDRAVAVLDAHIDRL